MMNSNSKDREKADRTFLSFIHSCQMMQTKHFFCLYRASIVSKTLFNVSTDAHYYKIIEMLKQFKIIIPAPTSFGSRRNHH